MAKQYKGSLSLEWFNKQKSIISLDEKSIKSEGDIPAPRINWINKEEALFYEINQKEGKGNAPYWVNRDDIRVREARPLVFQKAFKVVEKDKKGTIPGTNLELTIKEITKEDEAIGIDNILIKGDNLLALNALKKHFGKLPESDKVKCIYIDPPYNTGAAFELYDDNLAHSEWLTLMRDRLVLLKKLLRDDGCIFIHVDDNEVFYLKALADEVFGRDKFVNSISIKSSTPSGPKTAHKDKTILKQKDTVLLYKNSDKLNINPQYKRKENWDTHFNFVVDKVKKTVSPLKEFLIKNKVIDEGQNLTDIDMDKKAHYDFIMRFKEVICQTQSFKNEDIKEKSQALVDKVLIVNEGEENETMYYNGRQLSPLSSSVNEVLHNNKLRQDISILLCDFWDDIDFQNTQNEGGVSFPTSKKPEELLHRIFSLVTQEGDLILDCFGGSGSSFAVAHKMKRRWIGIEIGNHAMTHIIPRLKGVILGQDQSGISKSVNWQGGGAFKYYILGESIIKVDKVTGKGEFNWSLGKKYIQEALLNSYDYVILEELDVFPAKLFKDGAAPTIGKLIGNTSRSIYGVSVLVAPNEKEVTISNEDIKSIYNVIRKQKDFNALVIFTNKGIDIAQDAMPEDMDIIKVPHAIFAELER